MLAPTYSYVADLVRRRTSISLAERQIPWVEARLTPLARRLGEDSVDAMVTRLRASGEGELHDLVAESVTVTETSFFRDPTVYDELATHLLPAAWAARRPAPVRVWSAGCASGQEPYSVAMLATDFVSATPGAQVGVLATDWSDAMVERTRAATYSHPEVNRGLPARRLVQAMQRDGAGWRVRPEVAALVTARRHNLVTDPVPVGAVDVVLLRNVLIYFDPDVRQRVLDRVVAALAPGGFLLLGGSEWPVDAPAGLVRGRGGRAPWYRLDRAEPTS
jgi:chemotaxis protein methyltransferase CheR